jgi:hypothetical protein
MPVGHAVKRPNRHRAVRNALEIVTTHQDARQHFGGNILTGKTFACAAAGAGGEGKGGEGKGGRGKGGEGKEDEEDRGIGAFENTS